MTKVSGIYLITCRPNGGLPYYYVGQSIDIERRKRFHFQRLRSGKHHNKFVQRCFSKHGELSFHFEILEECEHSELDDRETWWLTEMVGLKRCLNLSRDAVAPHRGKRLSDEHRQSISRGGKGKKRGEKTKAAISAANAGSKNSMFGKAGALSIRSKPVVGRCIATGEMVRFESANIAEKMGFSQASISRCCNGMIPVHLGFQWLFDTGEDVVFEKYEQKTRREPERLDGAYIPRPVIGTSVETGETIKFSSMSEAGRNGFNLKCISNVCRGASKTHKGYFWRYEE